MKRSKGEGTIYQRKDGSWCAQITLPDGKRVTKYGKTQSQVRDWLLGQRKALQDGLLTEGRNITFGQLLARYYNDVAVHTLKPKTLESYEGLIRLHIQPTLGRIKLSALTPVHLQNLYSEKKKQGYSNRTVQYIHAVIRRVLAQGVKWGLTTRNVAEATDAPKNTPKPPEILTEDQIKKLLSVAEGRMRAILILAVYTGMRQGEILGLHWEDISGSEINIRHTSQTLHKKGIVISEPKTEKSRRTITVSQTVLDALGEPGDGLVFQTSTGRPVSARNVGRDYKVLLKRAGLPNVTFHSLRHFHASALLSKNIHPKIVQERLGHSRIDITLDTYSHVIPGMQKEAAEKIDELLRV